MKVPVKCSRLVGKATLLGKRYAPEVLLALGIAGVVAGTVMACKATTKYQDVLDEHEKKMEKQRRASELAKKGEIEYSENDAAQDKLIILKDTAIETIKTYGPAATVFIAGVLCICVSHGILKKRYLGAVAAYVKVADAFKQYRGRVIEDVGEDKDLEYRHGIKKEEIAYTYADEEGNETVGHEEIHSILDDDLSDLSGYSKIFYEPNPNFKKDPQSNEFFLDAQRRFWQIKLETRGYVFLNEVLISLGFEPTKYGQIVGWRYDKNRPIGDNQIDFGIHSVRNKRFRDGLEAAVILDFNVDGPILDDVDLELS